MIQYFLTSIDGQSSFFLKLMFKNVHQLHTEDILNSFNFKKTKN